MLTKNDLPMKLYGSRVVLYVRKANGGIVSIDGYNMTENTGEVLLLSNPSSSINFA